jgi:hypothetical protein
MAQATNPDTFGDPAAEVYRPGQYPSGDPTDAELLALGIRPSAPADLIPENIFTLEEVDAVVEWWSVGLRRDGSTLLVHIPPRTLISGGAPIPRRILPLTGPGAGQGVWRPVDGYRARPVFGQTTTAPNDAVHFRRLRGNASLAAAGTPQYEAFLAAGTAARERWRSLYPTGHPLQPDFPFEDIKEKDRGTRMKVNIGRMLWRWHWRCPLPRAAFNVSHLAAPAHRSARYPDSPYTWIHLVQLESGLQFGVNDSRIPCNSFGLWRRANAPGLPLCSDSQLVLPNHVSACWHGLSCAWPCYGPKAASDAAVQVIAQPTHESPGRYKQVAGPRAFKHPAASRDPGAHFPVVPTGDVSGGEASGSKRKAPQAGGDPADVPDTEEVEWTGQVDQAAAQRWSDFRQWDGVVLEEVPTGAPVAEAPAGPHIM